MPNIFSIADDILIEGFNELGRDHDATLDKVFMISREANLKLIFRCNSIPFFGEVISQQHVGLDHRKVQALLTCYQQYPRRNYSHVLIY